MFGHTYYHSVIKKYVALFGTLFNDINIERKDSTGTVVQSLKVPLSYAPKEKVLARLAADPALDRPYAVLLPRMSFEMTSMSYDGSRKLNTLNRLSKTNASDPSTAKNTYMPVPYNLQFSLYIMCKNAEDGSNIIEQILPFFTPEWTSTVNLVPELGIKLDIPIVLDSITSEDSYEGDFETRRSLTWTLNFTLKGYVFGPTRTTKIIKFADTTLLATSDTSTAVVVGEGVTTNSYPVTANNTPPLNIVYEDDWSIQTDWTNVTVTIQDEQQ